MAIATLGAIALIWTPEAPYRLIYNASNSVPTGFYLAIIGREPRRGALMLVALPGSWRRWAADRHYLPAHAWALKRVTGVPGDLLCANRRRIVLNGVAVATRQIEDSAGRPMPSWTGCWRLLDNQWFLLNAPVLSFDSRYFGPVPTSAFRGIAVPL
jgi:conjugative transfer signal peptidase TraF